MTRTMMTTVEIQGFNVQGLHIRTCNADEMQPSTARIGPLWRDFASEVAPRMAPAAQVYGVYHRYESDANGAFEVLAGTDALLQPSEDAVELSLCEIQSGSYVVFEATGVMPQAVIDAWGRIWRYFADPQCPHQRAYTTDFERYGTAGRIDIFIAVRAL